MTLLPPEDSGSVCTFNSDPSGPTAQVLIVVSAETPRTLELDRQLGHVFTTVPGLGDEAYQEDSNIFARAGGAWVAISLVAPGEPSQYQAALAQAAAAAIARVPPGAAPAPVNQAPGKIVGTVPTGGGRNSRWPGIQRRFGGNLDQLKNVVYQPDVVLIGGGPRAMRDVSSDGLTWTVAGTAPGVDKLRVGRIMAATTLAVGRVVAISRAGPNAKVTLGPMALTDLIRKATFNADNAPLRQPIYQSVALPSAPTKAAAAVSRPTSGGGTLTTTPICCTYTGMRITYDHPAGRLAGTVEFATPKPTVDFRIVIDGGKLKEASFRLNSTAALDYQLDGATTSVAGNFNSGDQVLPVSVTIPLGGAFSLTLNQSFRVSMQLAGAASFKARAEYAFKGNLGFSYKNGRFERDAAALATRTGILNNTSGFGLGPNVISLNWTLRATVGVGLAGLSAGGWYAVSPGLAVAIDGLPGSPTQGCVTARVLVKAQYGVGYTIPNFAVSIINAIVGKLGGQPIAAFGGPKSAPFTIWDPGQGQACPAP